MGGLLRQGTWLRADTWETSDDGAFKRQQSKFRDRVERRSGARYIPETGRYHLYVSYACPWAHRTLIIRALKGLEQVISVSIAEPFMTDDGWEFANDGDSPTGESIERARYLREIYLRSDPQFTGRVTVPVLWDRRHASIVNNESREILNMLDLEFDDLATRPISLYPESLKTEIERVIDAIYAPINDGVYRCGFAANQHAYDAAFQRLFAALDHWNDVLARQRYLCGEQLTEADICLFTTLIRFDPVYYVHFKCNERRIQDYENLSNYLRELYQLPDIRRVCRFDHIKRHYYLSHPQINPTQIVPRGPDLSWLSTAHGRERLAGGPPRELSSRSHEPPPGAC